MFTNEDPTTILAVGTELKPAINPLIVTIPGVIKQLQSLKPYKASGPDEIPPWFLKDYAVEIGHILTALYQDSVDTGHVPSKWKRANVCGVFKDGEKLDPSKNYYRSISLTCISSKVLEHIIHSHDEALRTARHLNRCVTRTESKTIYCNPAELDHSRYGQNHSRK